MLIGDVSWGWCNGGHFETITRVIFAYPDEKYENLLIDLVFSGVEKGNVSFKIAEDGFFVKASKEGVEYADSYSICCPVDPENQLQNTPTLYL